MAGSNLDIAPTRDEIECSIFGPGYGESVIIHIGDNQWMIVDSCIDPTSKKPIPLEYLRQLNVDVSTQVRLVVATHWHDDHIRGLWDVLEACSSAEFVCSEALKKGEFLTLLRINRTGLIRETSGVREFKKIIRILEERSKTSHYIGPKFAMADRLLWRGNRQSGSTVYRCEVHSLSPSDASILLAHNEIKSLLSNDTQTENRVPSTSPNHFAVALWIAVGELTFLLGSDLEESGDETMGWSVILNSNTKPVGHAQVFKIPHHGSKTAHLDGVWTQMLVYKPKALLTPFVRGKVALPTRDDAQRILNLTDQAYVTAPPIPRKSIKRSGTVEKTIRETAQKITPLFQSSGHVRLRAKPAQGGFDWTVEKFGEAVSLERAHR